MMNGFSEYGHAIVAIATTGLIGLLLGPMVGRRKAMIGLPPGAEPEADYASDVFRMHRAYQNLCESIGFFIAVTLAAILAGASPFWVNLLASIFLLARMLMIVIHVRGLGSSDMSLRSFAYGAGWLAAIALAVLAITGVFFSG